MPIVNVTTGKDNMYLEKLKVLSELPMPIPLHKHFLSLGSIYIRYFYYFESVAPQKMSDFVENHHFCLVCFLLCK